MKKALKYLILFFVGKIAMTLILFFLFFLWIDSNSRTIPYLDKIIEFEIGKFLKADHVSLKNNKVVLNNKDKIELEINDILIQNKGVKVGHVEQIKITFDLKRLFYRSTILDDVYTKGMEIRVDLSQFKLRDTSANNKEIQEVVNKFLGKMYEYFTTELKLENSKIIFVQAEKEIEFKIDNFVSTAISKQHSILLKAEFEGQRTDFILLAKKSDNSEISVNIAFNYFPIINSRQFLEQANFPFLRLIDSENHVMICSGKYSSTFDKYGNIGNLKLEINITPSQKKINLKNESLYVASIESSVSIKNNFSEINFDKFNVKFSNNATISSNGIVTTDQKVSNIFGNHLSSIKLHYFVENIPTKYIKTLWPEYYATNVREWIIEKISNGQILSGKGVFNFTEDFFKTKKILTSDIDAVLNVKDLNLDYYNNLPQISGINGEVKFNGESLAAKIDNAKIGESSLNNIKVDLSYDIDRLKIKGDVSGPAYEYNYFIPEYYQNVLREYHLDLKDIKEHLDSNVVLDIPLDDDFHNENLLLNIRSNFKNIVISEKFKNFPIKNGIFEIKNDSNIFAINASGYINNSHVDINFSNKLKDLGEVKLAAKVLLNNEFLKSIGLGDDVEIISTNPEYLEIDINQDLIKLHSNLLNSNLFFKKIGFSKQPSNKLSLSANARLSNNTEISFEDIKAIGSSIKASGDFVYDYVQGKIKALSLVANQIGKNKDLKVSYTNVNNIKATKIKAKEIDLSSADLKSFFAHEDSQEEQIIYNLNIDKLSMKNNEVMTSFLFDYDCINGFVCKKFHLKANIGNDSYVEGNIIKKDKKEFIVLTSNDGSAFLRSLNLYKEIKKGNLEISLQKTKIVSPDNKQKFKLNGELKMTDFAITNQSFIIKLLLSATSIPGIFNMFGGNSIKMNQYKSEVDYENNVLNIDGRMSGPNLDITLKGFVDTNSNKIKLSGSIVPSVYGINKFVSNIPIVGTVIAGGGSEAIAANYSITGSTEEAVVKINPFTLLPLSFFKKMFE